MDIPNLFYRQNASSQQRMASLEIPTLDLLREKFHVFGKAVDMRH